VELDRGVWGSHRLWSVEEVAGLRLDSGRGRRRDEVVGLGPDSNMGADLDLAVVPKATGGLVQERREMR